MRQKLSIRFAIEGDLRFISHHDTLRLFERALARAEIPARRSEGFNPRPRMSLPLPRNVGIASHDEELIVELASPLTAQDARQRLEPQMPGGVRLLLVELLPAGAESRPQAVSYALELEPDEAASLPDRITQFREAKSVFVNRVDKKTGRSKPIDVRGFVTDIRLEANRLHWTQSITPWGTAKPGEVLDTLGMEAREILHRIERTHVVRDAGPRAAPQSGSIPPE